MSDTTFALLAEESLGNIFEKITDNQSLSDIDADLIDGVLRIDFDSGAVVIINRQESARQLWLASPEGPAHFDYDEQRGQWLDDRTGESLINILNQILSKQVEEPIVLEE